MRIVTVPDMPKTGRFTHMYTDERNGGIRSKAFIWIDGDLHEAKPKWNEKIRYRHETPAHGVFIIGLEG